MKNNKLTVIIAFKNEGDEVKRTVESIKATSHDGVSILLVNDNSDDKYDYATLAEEFDCRYIELFKSLGVAMAREVGIKACDTEYFVIMDGHMRIYDESWQQRVIESLALHPASIICSATSNLAEEKPGADHYGGQFGAYVNFASGEEYTLKWIEEDKHLNEDKFVRQVPCVLGAFYASSKTHWNQIGGLYGLEGYGFDEAWMSIKTWLVGGECLSLKDFVTGHLYRNTPSAKINYDKYYANQILMNNFFTQDDAAKNKYSENLRQKIGQDMYEKAQKVFNDKREWFLGYHKDFFNDEARKRRMFEFLEMNTVASSQSSNNMVK